jgi:hypothetical protein
LRGGHRRLTQLDARSQEGLHDPDQSFIKTRGKTPKVQFPPAMSIAPSAGWKRISISLGPPDRTVAKTKCVVAAVEYQLRAFRPAHGAQPLKHGRCFPELPWPVAQGLEDDPIT